MQIIQDRAVRANLSERGRSENFQRYNTSDEVNVKLVTDIVRNEFPEN